MLPALVLLWDRHFWVVINGNSTFGTVGTGCRAGVGNAGLLSF